MLSRTVGRAPGGSVSAFAMLCLLVAAVSVTGGGCGGEVVSVKTTGELEQQIAGVSQPVLVKFYKAWCPACMQLGPTLAALSDEYSDKALFLQVESSRDAALRQQYSVAAYPTVVLFVDGKERERWVNEHSKSAYRRALDSAIAESALKSATTDNAGGG